MLTTRQQAPDAFWVRKLYQVVYPRSPPLWERLKGLLGIPLEASFTSDGRLEGMSRVRPIVDVSNAKEFMVEEILARPFSPNSNGELNHINEDVDVERDDVSTSSSVSSSALRESVRGLCIIASSSSTSTPRKSMSLTPNAQTQTHIPSKLRLSSSGDYSRPQPYGHTPNNSVAAGPSAEELRKVRERRGSVTPHFVPDFAHLGGSRLSVTDIRFEGQYCM
jgi:hypothetical protein